MALSRDQKDVFCMAVEVIECNGIKAMSHENHARVQSSKQPGQRAVVDWAVDYLSCLPERKDLRGLIIRAHVPSDEAWSRHDIKRCGGAMRGFYSRVHQRRLYGTGLRYLSLYGS